MSLIHLPKQWVAARDRLIAANLPIGKDGCITVGDALNLKFNNVPIWRDLELYLSETPRQLKVNRVFDVISKMLYELQSNDATTEKEFSRLSQLSDIAIRYMKQSSLGKLDNLWIEILSMRDVIQERSLQQLQALALESFDEEE